jgi:ligand-binding SRPBCC domain-containing protein
VTVYTLQRETFLPLPLAEVFEFFSRARNLEAITPAFLRFQVLTPEPIVMRPGAEIEYLLRVRGFPVHWKTVIETWNPPHEFSDVQARGPYKMWHHTHRFREGEGGTWMEDIVRYALPFGPLGRVAHWLQVRRDVEGIFDYRAKKIEELLLKTSA